MGEAKKRKVHTAEFKAKVGLEAVRGVKTITEIAQAYGVHPQLVGQWKKEILESAGACSAGRTWRSQEELTALAGIGRYRRSVKVCSRCLSGHALGR